MGRYDAKTSLKGQTTIPIEVRKALGLAPGGTVQFVTGEAGEVRVVAKQSTLRHLKGLFGPLPEPLDIDKAIMEEVARRNDVNGRDAD
jgi:bifunctional DNA-binding transcriptional regulator/antitoxin component of YhaV-PrlF toxin-antitoxin module